MGDLRKEIDDAEQKEIDSVEGEEHQEQEDAYDVKRYSSSHDKHKHHSRKRSHKNSKRIKKRVLLYVNIVCALFAVSIIFLTVLFDKYTKNAEEAQNDNLTVETTVDIAGASIHLEIPIFTEEIPLVSSNVAAFCERDLSVPLESAIQHYKVKNNREDKENPVTIAFNVLGKEDGTEVASVQIEVLDADTSSTVQTFSLSGETRSVDIYHLKTNTHYNYQISLVFSDSTSTSVIGSFKTAKTPRMVTVDGIVNVRDIGGWKTIDGKVIKQGLLYRGSELDGAVEKSYKLTENGRNVMLSSLGIRTDMDLRAPEDNVNGLCPLGESVGHTYYNAPMYEAAFTNTEPIRKIFSDLADESKYPVYLHCTYGLDRTGTVCYLLEALLGVDDDDLMRDYELSAMYHGGVKSEMMANFTDMLSSNFAGTTRQEQAEKYLLSVGVTKDEIDDIRSILLEG